MVSPTRSAERGIRCVSLASGPRRVNMQQHAEFPCRGNTSSGQCLVSGKLSGGMYQPVTVSPQWETLEMQVMELRRVGLDEHRERKSACFWLLPSSATLSPGSIRGGQRLDGRSGSPGQARSSSPRSGPTPQAFFTLPPRPAVRLPFRTGCQDSL